MRYADLVFLGTFGVVVAKWEAVDEAGFRKAVENNEQTLVAYIPVSISQKHTNNDASYAIQELTQGASTLQTVEYELGSLQEEWDSVRSSEKDNTVLTIDCSATNSICREFDVVSYPTIRLHRQDGRVERYRGPRKARDITAYLRRSSRFPITPLDAKNASTFTSSADDVVIVANLSHDDKDDENELETRFSEAAELYRDRYTFAIRRWKKGHGVSLECTNNVNFEQMTVTDLANPLAVELFIKQCARPLIPEFTRRNEGEYSKMGKSIVHYFTADDEDREAYTSAMRSLAKTYKDYLIFVTTDVNEYPDMPAMTGHRPGAQNVLSVVNTVKGGVYPFRGKDITAETVTAFLKDVSTGKVKAWDGVPLPAEGEEEGIKHEEL